MKATKTDTPTPNQYLADLQKEEAELGLLKIQTIADEHESLLKWFIGINNQIKQTLSEKAILNYDGYISKLSNVMDKGLEWVTEVDALPSDIYSDKMVHEWLEATFLLTTVENFEKSVSAYKIFIEEAKKEIKKTKNALQISSSSHAKKIDNLMIEHEKLLKSKNSALRAKQTSIDNLNQGSYRYQQKVEQLEMELFKSNKNSKNSFIYLALSLIPLFLGLKFFSRGNIWFAILLLIVFSYMAYFAAVSAKIIPDYFNNLD